MTTKMNPGSTPLRDDPNRPETEEDGFRAGQLRQLKVIHDARVAQLRSIDPNLLQEEIDRLAEKINDEAEQRRALVLNRHPLEVKHAEPPDLYVSWPTEYDIRGTRRWDELTEAEQDEYLVACFQSDAKRAEIEIKTGLYDRVAGSIAGHLLGFYQQFDDQTGEARYAPPTPRIANHVLELRRRVLKGTALGARLDAALDRAEGKHVPTGSLEDLSFYSVAPSERGMEILDEKCSDDAGWMVPTGFNKWNDFDELDRLHYRETSAKWKASREDSLERMLADSQRIFELNKAVRDGAKPAGADATPGSAAPVAAPPPTDSTPTSGIWTYVSAIAAGAMLAGAFVDGSPYGYFTILRVLVCGALVALALRAVSHDFVRWASALGVGALVYNPLVPLHLGREVWRPINLITIALILIFTAYLWWHERPAK